MATLEEIRIKKILRETGLRLDRLENEALSGIIGLLQQLRKDIADRLLTIPTDRFEAFHLQALMRELNGAIEIFNRNGFTVLTTGFESAYAVGGEAVAGTLAAAGLSIKPQINFTQLQILHEFSAELIRNISADMRSQINRSVRLAAIGGKTPYATMQDVSRILGIKARDGVWGARRRPEVVKGIAARAEAIVRTEMGRVYNLGHNEQANQVDAPLVKGWLATGDHRTRLSHLRAHRTYTGDGMIPLKQPFIVGGVKMMHPHDPTAPAREVVNCRCRMVTLPAGVTLPELPLDAAIKKILK